MVRNISTFVLTSLQALPLLAVEVASLQFSYPMNTTTLLTSAHQSEKLLRNCIDRGVYSLKLMRKELHCLAPYDTTEPSSDVSEESILEFCFAPRNVRPDRPAQVELWLNWINLSPEFLSRFIQVFCLFSGTRLNSLVDSVGIPTSSDVLWGGLTRTDQGG